MSRAKRKAAETESVSRHSKFRKNWLDGARTQESQNRFLALANSPSFCRSLYPPLRITTIRTIAMLPCVCKHDLRNLRNLHRTTASLKNACTHQYDNDFQQDTRITAIAAPHIICAPRRIIRLRNTTTSSSISGDNTYRAQQLQSCPLCTKHCLSCNRINGLGNTKNANSPRLLAGCRYKDGWRF